MNKFIDYLVTGKGLSNAKALKVFEELNRLDAVNPHAANDLLEDTLRHIELITLLKEYILTEDVKMPKIRISKSEFEEHFHIIDSRGRGRKPKGFANSSPFDEEDEKLDL